MTGRSFGVVLPIVAAFAAYAQFVFIWNRFYDGAPMLFDAGWYGELVYRSSPRLQNPSSVVFNAIGRDYYATHFAPWLWLLSLPSHLLPVSMPVWLATVEGLKFAALAAVGGMAVRASYVAGETGARERFARRMAAMTIAMLVPFNGVMLATSIYPHYETWWVPLALGFLVMLFRGHLWFAAIFFSAALLVREDMGFHLCGLLVLATALRAWRGGPDRWAASWIGFAAAAFAWSIAALVVMRIWFPGDDAFLRVYVGDPPFSHVGWEGTGRRLTIYFQERSYLWLPVLAYALWAWRIKSVWPLLGYAAFVPWWLLSFLARGDFSGTLDLYYGFPFVLALLWPLAGILAFRGRRSVDGRTCYGWVLIALVLSILGFARTHDLPTLVRDMLVPRLGVRVALEATVDRLARARDTGEVVGIDDAVAAFAPADFNARNLYWQTPAPLTLTAYFENGRMVDAGRQHAASLNYHYRLPGTGLIIAAARPLSWLALEPIEAKAVMPGAQARGRTDAP